MLTSRALAVFVFSLLFFFGTLYLSLGGDDATTSTFSAPIRVMHGEGANTLLRRDLSLTSVTGAGRPPTTMMSSSSSARAQPAAYLEPATPSTYSDSASGALRTTPSSSQILDDADIPSCARQYFEANYLRTLQTTSDAERKAAVIKEAGIEKVYMIHYTPMRKRRSAMTELLGQHSISVQWVDGFDKEVLNESTAACFHAWNPADHRGAKAKRHALRKWVPLGKSQRSVVIKHHSALYDAYRQGYRNVLVLEDDAYLRVQFKKRLAEVMRAVPPSYDVIMIGGCMNMRAWRRKFQTEMLSKHVYRKREARCAHAFVASQKGIRHLLSSLPLTHAIDFQMTAAMLERDMEVYWIEPWLSVQGPSLECVTMFDLGAGCGHSVEKIGREYDARFVNDTSVDALWEIVPAFHSKR